MEHRPTDLRTRRSLLVLKTGATHEEIARAEGDFEDWFLQALDPTADAAVADARTGELPAPGLPGGVIVTGSPDMVTDRADWMERAAAWLRERVGAGRPVLGVCFGHQLLAWALGGIVDDNPGGRECGAVEVEQTEAGRADPLLGEMPRRFDAFSVHRQSVRRLPPGAELLARTSQIEVQAARYGERAWGVQFHPEFTESIVRAYVRQYAAGLVDDGIDPDAVLAAVRPSRTDRLLRRFHDICQEKGGA